jgi:kynurenine formamidase
MKRFLAPLLLPLALLLGVLAQTSPQKSASRTAAIDSSKLVDLTYSFDESTIYWPTAQAFHWEKEKWGKTPAGYWYSAARYSASEHGGTHIDSPIHFAEGKSTVDRIPLAKLVAPAVVVDVSKKCAANPDYAISAADIQSWENAHGAIPEGNIVLFRTGWGRFWPDKKRYIGSDTPGDTAHLHFPSLGRSAAEFLTKQRRIAGIGVDTASIDVGISRDFIVHQIINGANLYGLENLANLNQLPETGALVIALPMKIKGGSGAPTRVIAILP